MSVAQFIYMCESNLHPHTSQSGQSLADNEEQRQESDAATLAPSVICRLTMLCDLAHPWSTDSLLTLRATFPISFF
jgi:hypothetical protein